MFGGTLSQSQVNGFERLLDVWFADYAKDGSVEELAYNLATSKHETAATMQPITERGSRSYFNKYEPGTRIGKVLGNTKPGDGYRYRGEGDVQNTGRRNAAKATKRLNEVFGINVDLVKNPEKRGDPLISAHSIFLGNREGWWTGRDLGNYIDGINEEDDEDFREYVKARAVVNGSDRARLIAGYAIKFEAALRAAGYDGKAPPIPTKVRAVVEDAAAKDRTSTTEIAAIGTGVAGTASVVKQAVDAVNDTTTSLMSAGPWVVAGLLAAAFAGYIIYERRRKKAKAGAAL